MRQTMITIIDGKDKPVKGVPVSSQQGSTLVVCLMVLCMLTLLGVTSLLTTTTETKITHTSRKSEQAFFAAEAGIEFVKKLTIVMVQEDLKVGMTIPDDLTANMSIPNPSALGCVLKVVAVNSYGSGYDAYRICFEAEGNDPHNKARRTIRADVQVAPKMGGQLISQGEITDIYR